MIGRIITHQLAATPRAVDFEPEASGSQRKPADGGGWRRLMIIVQRRLKLQMNSFPGVPIDSCLGRKCGSRLRIPHWCGFVAPVASALGRFHRPWPMAHDVIDSLISPHPPSFLFPSHRSLHAGNLAGFSGVATSSNTSDSSKFPTFSLPPPPCLLPATHPATHPPHHRSGGH